MNFKEMRNIFKKQKKYSCLLKGRRGFTLIEMTVSLTLFIVVITLLMGTIITIARLETKGEATRETQQNARIMLEQVSRYTRQAREINWEDKDLDGTEETLTLDFKRGTDERRMYFFLSADNLITCVPFEFGIDPDPLTTPSLLSPINPDSVNVTNFNIETFPGIPGLVRIELVVEPDYNTMGDLSEFTEDQIRVDTTVILSGQYN